MLRNLRSSTSSRPGTKFSAAPRLGLQSDREQQYGDFCYRIWHARTGMASSRTRYSLKITDRSGAPRHYLTGFRSAAEAERAAREWIDEADVTVPRRDGLRRDEPHRRPGQSKR